MLSGTDSSLVCFVFCDAGVLDGLVRLGFGSLGGTCCCGDESILIIIPRTRSPSLLFSKPTTGSASRNPCSDFTIFDLIWTTVLAIFLSRVEGEEEEEEVEEDEEVLTEDVERTSAI